MNKIFLLGIFMIPFENFFFAPSEGWAAVSPLIFMLYLFGNMNNVYRCIKKYRSFFFLLGYGTILFCINSLFSDAPFLNLLKRYIRAFITFLLGMINLYSFDIYFIQKKHSTRKIERLIIISYSIALLVGISQYFIVKFNISAGYKFFDLIFKRNYLRLNRVQFFFTEPSLIGMHVFGVLLPFYVFMRNNHIRSLMIIFSVFALFAMSSVRFVLDTLVALLIFAFFLVDWRKTKNIIIIVMMIIIAICSFYYAYVNNGRVRAILNNGIYFDGSLAARWFRVHASLRGYKNHILNALAGYGMGNEAIPLNQGHSEAIKFYRSSYMREVDGTENAAMGGSAAVSYSFFIRFISEFGIIISVFSVLILISHYLKIHDSQQKAFFWIMLYSFLQFESYGFYTFWLYIVFCQLKKA